MISEKDLSDRVVKLFEERKVFLISKITLSSFAKTLGVSKREMKGIFSGELDYTFKEMLTIFRTSHARDLIIHNNIPYSQVWKLSGFKSHKEFERSWEKVVN